MLAGRRAGRAGHRGVALAGVGATAVQARAGTPRGSKGCVRAPKEKRPLPARLDVGGAAGLERP
eukprot:13967786-Alexandrium_andersonii.AAC.1